MFSSPSSLLLSIVSLLLISPTRAFLFHQPHPSIHHAAPRRLYAATTAAPPTVFTPALEPKERLKDNTAADGLFYSYPRLCTHVDDRFIEQLTEVYRREIPANGAVLDLMSSWVSHLPPEVEYSRVDGHGLNMEELRANPRLSQRLVQDLNKNATLPFVDDSYDAVLIACSIQYLQKPETVLQEIHRVLKPQGKLLISFSNRMFFDKAIYGWVNRGDIGRVRLVCDYIASLRYQSSSSSSSPAFHLPPTVVSSEQGVAPTANIFERLIGALQRAGPLASDPFFVVIGKKLPAP